MTKRTTKSTKSTKSTYLLSATLSVVVNGERDDETARRIERVSERLAHDSARNAQRTQRVNVTPRPFSIFASE